MLNIYVIKKYVLAGSIAEAIKKEGKEPVQDCWLDDQSRKDLLDKMVSGIGAGFTPEVFAGKETAS